MQGLEVTVRIASALQELLVVGHVKYRRFESHYSLHSAGVVDRLHEMAKQMEADLDEWRTTVEELRSKYYHMNYFTTRQLSLICQELSVTQHTFEPWFLNFMQCVCPVLDIDQLARAAVNVAKERETVKKCSFFGIVSSDSSLSLEESNGYEEPKITASKDDLESLQSMYTEKVLKVDDLDETQQGLFAELCEYDFSEELILVSLTEKGCSFDDLYDYCLTFSSMDVDQGTKRLSAVQAETVVQEKELTVLPLNENHPLVKEMIESGFDLELGIEAAEVCGCNKEQMFDYCLDRGIVSDYQEENEPE